MAATLTLKYLNSKTFANVLSSVNKVCEKYGYVLMFPRGNSCCVRQINYDFKATNIEVEYDWDDNMNLVINRFGVCFAGFGTLRTQEEEDFVFASLCNAKRCCEYLNKTIERWSKNG